MAILVQTALLVAVLAVQYVASFEGDLDMELNLRGDVVEFPLPTPDPSCQDSYKAVHKDTGESKCKYWAKRRECVLNQKWMQENCQQSCRVCKCQDTDNCEYWASIGECFKGADDVLDNQEWMLDNCAKSCHQPPKCRKGEECQAENLYTDPCPVSITSKYCETYPDYEETRCRLTCGLCGSKFAQP